MEASNEPTSEKSRLTKPLRVRVSAGTYTRLVQLAGVERRVSGVVRDAIRLYLDNQEDIRASRAHFTRSFRRRLDQVDGEHHLIRWYLTVLIVLTGQLGAAILNQLQIHKDSSATRVSGPGLVSNAIAVIERGGGEDVQQRLLRAVEDRIES